jgi:uncharacterized protein (DUF1778 family)
VAGKEIKIRLSLDALAEVAEAARRSGLRRTEFIRACAIRAARRELGRGAEGTSPAPRAA